MENNNDLMSVLKILDDEGILKDAILIGSWSLIFYQEIFENFSPLIRTTDIDFYIPNVKKIKEKNNLIGSFKINNYDIVHDSLTNKSTFISPDGFEIEFLTRLNKERDSTIQVGNTKVFAESIPYLDIFSYNFIEVPFNGLMVNVISPSSFVLQKLLINDLRKTEKKEKDINAVKYVLSYIKMTKNHFSNLKETYDQLPKKWRKTIDKSCAENNLKLFD